MFLIFELQKNFYGRRKLVVPDSRVSLRVMCLTVFVLWKYLKWYIPLPLLSYRTHTSLLHLFPTFFFFLSASLHFLLCPAVCTMMPPIFTLYCDDKQQKTVDVKLSQNHNKSFNLNFIPQLWLLLTKFYHLSHNFF